MKDRESELTAANEKLQKEYDDYQSVTQNVIEKLEKKIEEAKQDQKKLEENSDSASKVLSE